MRSILFLTTLLFVTMTTKAQTGTAADDAAIKVLVKFMEDGWTKKDGNHFATPFAENADYVVVNGMLLKGKQAIAAGHQQIFNTFYKETFIKATVETIRYVRPDVAVAICNAAMTGTSNGQPVDTKAKITLVIEKTAAGWQIVSFQNTQVQEPRGPGGN